MIIGPKYKICRRLGNGMFDKCQSQGYVVSEARHSKSRKGGPKALSDFGKQLLEKQRIRMAYGVPERQLRRYVDEVSSAAEPASKLIQLLESRLDNVVYRSGMASSRRLARQMVSHGHITVEGRKVTIPSFAVKEGTKFSVRESSKEKPLFTLRKEDIARVQTPVWLTFDAEKLEGTVTKAPLPEVADMAANVSAVLEFYSR